MSCTIWAEINNQIWQPSAETAYANPASQFEDKVAVQMAIFMFSGSNNTPFDFTLTLPTLSNHNGFIIFLHTENISKDVGVFFLYCQQVSGSGPSNWISYF